MKIIRKSILTTLIITLAGVASVAQAQHQRPYRLTDRAMQQVIRRIEVRANRFKASLDRALDRSRLDQTRREDNINQLVSEFELASNQLRGNFNRRESTMADVRMVLERAAWIDRFMQRHRMQAAAERDWRLLRNDLNSLATAYQLAWNWHTPPSGNYGMEPQLSGTYRLNAAQSEDARLAVERVVRRLPYSQRQRISEALLARIEVPEMLALERRGRNVTLASSRAPRTVFEADGREHMEQYPNRNLTSRVRAQLIGDQLTINSTGDRATDYSVTFDPLGNGSRIRVTRRLYAERLTNPVIIQTVYDRVSDQARWTVFTRGYSYPVAGGVVGNYLVPNGLSLVTRLNNDLTSERSRAGDRFSLTVLSPAAYEGATIEGSVGNIDRSGRLKGRTEMALNLNQIRLRNGQMYRFDGIIESIRTINGETVQVDAEGAVRSDDSQTERTIERSAIGAAIGALIGAIADGGKGAAVGAAVGAGAGAGSVYIQGRDTFELGSGTELTIRSASPGESAVR
jgi:hypothetical protein